MMELIITLAAGVIVAGLFWALKSRRAKNPIKLPSDPFPEEWRGILKSGWPIYQKLPDDLRGQLEQLTIFFLKRIDFRGVDDLEITDKIRVLTAAQACLLLLNQGIFFTKKLRSVVIHPKAYSTSSHDSIAGVTTERRIAVQGQSWENGCVVLSWDNSHSGATNAKDGHNLVLHEFAHQLDQADGLADGVPALGSREEYKRWQKICSRVFADLQKKVDRGHKTVIDDYGATNAAEFFSVSTETFFEKPRQLNKKRPELYDLLREYYRVDPLTWR